MVSLGFLARQGIDVLPVSLNKWCLIQLHCCMHDCDNMCLLGLNTGSYYAIGTLLNTIVLHYFPVRISSCCSSNCSSVTSFCLLPSS